VWELEGARVCSVCVCECDGERLVEGTKKKKQKIDRPLSRVSLELELELKGSEFVTCCTVQFFH